MPVRKEIRLRRILVGGKALLVAMDHGVSPGPVDGLEAMIRASCRGPCRSSKTRRRWRSSTSC